MFFVINLGDICSTTIQPRKPVFDGIQKASVCPAVLVLPRFTQASNDSPEEKYGKNSLESAQPWSWLNPLLFGLALFVAIGDCPVKQCYSSLTGFAGKAVMSRTYLAQLPARGFVNEIKRTLERITTRSVEAFGHTGVPKCPHPALLSWTSGAYFCVCLLTLSLKVAGVSAIL